MNALKALGLPLFCCRSLILDFSKGKISTTNNDSWLLSLKGLAIANNVILQLNEIRADLANEYHII